MTYEQIKALEEILEQKCKEVDNHVKAKKNANGKDNVFAAFSEKDFQSGRTRKDITSPLEAQIKEAQASNEPNRFLVDYFGKPEVWNKAVGDLRLPRISQADFSKMNPKEQKEYEKQLLKNIVITLALLTNAANRITDVYPDSYKLKDRFIAEYIAYARMYNFKFPDDPMAFGINPDYEKGVCVLTGSVPGYSRFSVHFGSPINAAKILAEVNSIIIKVGPKLGIDRSQSLENSIQTHKRDRKGNESIENGINYAKNGEYELVDRENPQRKLKTYKLTEINKAKNLYLSLINTKRKNQTFTHDQEQNLRRLSKNIEEEIHGFLTPEMGYPLEIYELKTGMVNCHNGNRVSEYVDIVKNMQDEFEVEVAFKVFFATANLNRRERMYIAERAGLPLHILEKIEKYPTVIDKNKTESEVINKFLKAKTAKMDEKGKIEFIEKVLDVYKYYDEDQIVERKNFLDNIDFREIGISEKSLNDLKIREFLNEYKEALDYGDSERFITDDGWSIEFITTIANSTCAEQILEEIDIKDIVEILKSAGSDFEFGESIPAFSKKLSELSKADLKTLFIDGEFDRDSFESVLNAVDKNTKKRLILETIGVAQEELGDTSVIRSTIETMDTDSTTINQTLKMYDQIKTILDETTSDSRKEALDIEAMLEKIEEIDEVE